jgi:hypothetical protein
VLIIGVGHYRHGEGGEEPTHDGSVLGQLTSPPKSAEAVAEWFVNEFQNPDHPLGTVTMLVSDTQPMIFNAADGAKELPEATWDNVRNGMSDWKDVFQTHPDNMIVLYFCGHGISLGQRALVLFSDFANSDNPFAPAIDVDSLRGTLRNAQPGKQVFILDCCRTRADSVFANVVGIGASPISFSTDGRRRDVLVRQFALFPSVDGQKAFGLPGEVSVFTSCFLDAVRFAGFDSTTGKFVSTTALIFNAVDRLVGCRLPKDLRGRTVPTTMNSVSFEFNHIADPLKARSVVTISPAFNWPSGIFTASSITNQDQPPQQRASSSNDPYHCCVFEVGYGQWKFDGIPAEPTLKIQSSVRAIWTTVAYVELEVMP